MARNHRGETLTGEQVVLPEGHIALNADAIDMAQPSNVKVEAIPQQPSANVGLLIMSTVMEEPLFRR